MYVTLAVITQYFIYRKLKEAGISESMRYIFLLFGTSWLVIFILSHFMRVNPERNIFPGRTAEIFYAAAFTWIVITILAFFAVIAVEFFTCFSVFTGRKVFAAVLLTVVGSLYCMGEAYFVTRRDVKIYTSKLPENIDKLRIVYLTDVHLGGLYSHWHFKRVMNIVEDSSPDIFILCGDIIDGDMTYRQRELELLSNAAKHAPYGAYAVNGNHEYYHIYFQDVENIIRDCGINMLINERVEVAGIVIIGKDDNKYGWLSPYLQAGDDEKFILVIKHKPGLPFDAEGKFDLQISGHTHGGQFWPMGYLKNMEANSTQGLSRKAGGYVYVSNGAGFNGPMMRLFAPPEVTVIDIVRE